MFDIEGFIAREITHRPQSLLKADMGAHTQELNREIEGKKVLVIGGAGSIGSQFIRALLPFRPKALTVVDINENGLTELTRWLRSSRGLYMPDEYYTYALSFSDPIFRRIFREKEGFDIVANFSAHKHVRSEKNRFTVEAMLENNVLRADELMQLLTEYPPRHFFCVSTDKAANPVNVMGASKRIMEDMIMSYSDSFKVTTARFANVAFSNGSLPAGFIDRMMHRQPLAAPSDVRRYFVSPRESGELCLLACILGRNREIFFPKLGQEKMMTFSDICTRFLQAQGLEPLLCGNEDEAKEVAASLPEGSKKYPVVHFRSDTSGEKEFEEFTVEGEDRDMERFQALGVITGKKQPSRKLLEKLYENLNGAFASADFTKEDIIKILSDYLPTFHHIETGRNLDQKM